MALLLLLLVLLLVILRWSYRPPHSFPERCSIACAAMAVPVWWLSDSRRFCPGQAVCVVVVKCS